MENSTQQRGLGASLKSVAQWALEPLREPLSWACQRGLLSPSVREILPWRWAHRPFTIHGEGWTCRWMSTDFDCVGHELFWGGLRNWEKETAPVIFDHIRRSRCFVDIGAHCGMYTVLGCIANPNVHVVAVEPVPRNCAALSCNVKENHFDSRVTVLEMALGDSNGTVSFHQAEDSTMGSLALDGYHGQHGNVIQVNCRTLDSVVEELGIEPDFLKIDVEGFEDVVLGGASSVLSRHRPRIVLEANPGDPAGRMTAILASHGYAFQNITDNGLESRAEITPVAEYRNWLCVPPC